MRTIGFEYDNSGYFSSRIGTISTSHGQIRTPAFIFCATKGAIKPLSLSDMVCAETQVILANTYHLMLRPGSEYISHMGGIQKFMGWKGPVFTDSGGFQIFSLANGNNSDELKRRYDCGFNMCSIEKVDEAGVKCSSYYDGKKFFLSPETAIEIQSNLGSDILVVLDECPHYSLDKGYTKMVDKRNIRWAIRGLKKFAECGKDYQGLYGVVHGGVFKDLRRESAEFIANEDFFGQAIGGSLGRNKDDMEDVVSYTMNYVNRSKPTHLLGIGGVSDIFFGVKCGIDTFDCVIPTRIARHGGALVKKHAKGRINLRNSRFKNDEGPIEADCRCRTCTTHTKAYLHYLFSAREPIVNNLIAYHNVYFMNTLMQNIRNALLHINPIKSMNELIDMYLLS